MLVLCCHMTSCVVTHGVPNARRMIGITYLWPSELLGPRSLDFLHAGQALQHLRSFAHISATSLLERVDEITGHLFASSAHHLRDIDHGPAIGTLPQQRDGSALRSSAASAANAVHIVLAVLRRIEVHNQFHILYVQTTACHISCNEHWHTAIAKAVDRILTLILLLVAVKSFHRRAHKCAPHLCFEDFALVWISRKDQDLARICRIGIVLLPKDGL
mmetsp:Transcript_42662/g.76527  ORF Transcript_42662/g.76527 Transcript_42662/m.76527 type:complete len:217 (-) Transcript_42662:995-1645(-)